MAEENQNQEKLTNPQSIPVSQPINQTSQPGKKVLRPGGKNIREA